MSKSFGLKVSDSDNVAIVFAKIANGGCVEVADKAGNKIEIKVKNDIPYGHKIAITEILTGEKIYKYGEVIGQATAVIAIGEHVHVHNIDSLRGRGDLASQKCKGDSNAI